MGQLGLTQQQLAERARLDVTTISTFFNGHHWPQSRTRAKIEAALGWPVGALADVASGGEVPGAPPVADADPVEATIAAIPHLLEEDRELFLKVYRTRRDEHTARRLADLREMLERLRDSALDEEQQAVIAEGFERQIDQLRRAGYETLRTDTEP